MSKQKKADDSPKADSSAPVAPQAAPAAVALTGQVAQVPSNVRAIPTGGPDAGSSVQRKYRTVLYSILWLGGCFLRPLQ